MQLYLDCDGVLANFDKKALELFGMHPREFEDKFGSNKFWTTIEEYPGGFFDSLDLMEDAQELYAAVKHLKPIVLTGCPGQREWSQPQKRRWIARMFSPDLPVITVQSRLKSTYCNPGDIIIDDWPMYMKLWEDKGGIWILHTSAKESIAKLKELGVLNGEKS